MSCPEADKDHEQGSKKKWMYAVLPAIMLLVVSACGIYIVLCDSDDSSAANSGSCGSNVNWTYEPSTYTLTISGTGDIQEFYIWQTRWGGHESEIRHVIFSGEITRIGGRTFDSCTALTSITIPNSVTSIGDKAFLDCAALQTVNLGNSVVSIGYEAFEDCTSLTSITFPDTTTTIGNQAFLRCESLETVTFGNSIETIGYDAFNGCTSLTSVTLPDSTVSLGYKSFYGCTLLNDVTIGSSLTTIGYSSFQGCTSLRAVDIPDTVITIGQDAFSGCIALESIDIPGSLETISDSLFKGCIALKSVTIGDSAVSIGRYAFAGCIALGSVTIGSSVESIGNFAFEGCIALHNISIPDSVTAIGISSFSGCATLLTASLGDSVESIGNGAFYGCIVLTSISLPDSVTSIGDQAFYQCKVMLSASFGDSVETIGASAFEGCTLLRSVTLPATVTSIGERAFWGCSSVTSYTIDSSNPNYSTENGVLFNKNKTLLIQYPAGNEATLYTIPNTVTTIGDKAFDKSDTIQTIIIPNSVTTVGSSAFNDCSFRTVVIGNGVKNLDAFTFDDELVSITFGNSITTIPNSKFEGCSSLTEVIFGTSLLTIGNYAFSGTDSLETITIPSSVVSIGDYAFYNCPLLSTVTIGDHVVSIGSSAFRGCSSLVSITIPSSVTSIGTDAFYSCTSMTTFTVDPENTNYSSDSGVLFNKNKMTLIRYPGGRTQIVATIPDSVTSVDSRAFYGCSELSSIEASCISGLADDYSFSIGILRSITLTKNHSWGDWQQISAPTENEVGLERHICALCSEEENRVIPPTGHVHSPVAVPANDPTCTNPGNTAYWMCEECGRYFSDSACTSEINSASTVVPALGHDCEHHQGQDPTCTAAGWYEYDTCTRCDYTTYSARAALGHSIEHHSAVESTCTTDGNIEYWVCTECGEYYSNEECTVSITQQETVLKAHGHNPIFHEAVPSDCTHEGNTEHWTCSRCNKYYSDQECNNEISPASVSIPLTSHTPSVNHAVAPTCTETGLSGGSICTVCGHVIVEQQIIPALGHSYSATYEWAEDGSSCTVRIVCSHDAGHNTNLAPNVTSAVKTPATYSKKGVTTYSVSGIYDGFQYSSSKDVADIVYSAREDAGTSIYEYSVNSNDDNDMTDIFADAKNQNGLVEIKVNNDISSMTISFDKDAVAAIGSNTVSLKANIVEDSSSVDGAAFLIDVTLNGATFSEGKATIKVPLPKSVPAGKEVKVYFIDGDTKTDMNATLVDGNVVFETNHFSKYAIAFESSPNSNGGGFPVWIIAIIAVVAVAVIGGGLFFLKKKA